MIEAMYILISVLIFLKALAHFFSMMINAEENNSGNAVLNLFMLLFTVLLLVLYCITRNYS